MPREVAVPVLALLGLMAVGARVDGGQRPAPVKARQPAPAAPAAPTPAVPYVADASEIIEAKIGPTGDVEFARVVRGVPMLDAAALAAVRQWKYTPTLREGQPVAVTLFTTVTFSLGAPQKE